MKEMIIKLYSNPNFPIILFSTIGVLIVLLIITLVFAVKDSKKQAKQDLQNIDENNSTITDNSGIDVVSEQSLSSDSTVSNAEPVTIGVPQDFNSTVFEDIKFDAPSAIEESTFESSSDSSNTPNVDDFKNQVEPELPQLDQSNNDVVDNIYPQYQNISLPEIQNDLPKINEQTDEPVKVIKESPVINVKSLNDVSPEEYSIK